MKIGIMTFWWSEDNYGQLLQCYALQKYLRDQGHDAYLIRYDPRNDINLSSNKKKILSIINPIKVIKYIKYLISTRIKLIINANNQKRNPRLFSIFIEHNIKSSNVYLKLADLQSNPPKADIYIVGSDQVWNFRNKNLLTHESQMRAYLLDFGSKYVKRYAYAASFGSTEISNDLFSLYKNLLDKFQIVSVREKSSLGICDKLKLSNYCSVLDPVFLIEPEHYFLMSNNKNNKISDNKYLFLYLLGNPTDLNYKKLKKFAKSKNLKIVYVTANDRYDFHKKNYLTIEEWLFALRNSEIIITNSFHCSAFSILFNKQFAVLPLKGSYYNEMNSRIDDLFSNFQINRYINHNCFDICYEKINYQGINIQISDFKKNVFLNNLNLEAII